MGRLQTVPTGQSNAENHLKPKSASRDLTAIVEALTLNRNPTFRDYDSIYRILSEIEGSIFPRRASGSLSSLQIDFQQPVRLV
jgi:hypothetical protein